MNINNYVNMNQDVWNMESNKYQQLHYKELNPLRFIWAAALRSSEDDLRILGNFKNKKILELGCGGGQCSIWLAKNGGKCIGLDISQEQLKYAENLQEKYNIKFPLVEGNAEDLSFFHDNSFDIVFSVFGAIGFVDIVKCFKEVNRVLKEGGIFAFSWYSPIFDCFPHEGSDQLTICRSYFDKNPIINREVVLRDIPKREEIMSVDFHYTYGDWYKALIINEFLVLDIIELPVYKNEKWYSTWDCFPKYKISMIPSTTIWKSKKFSEIKKKLLEGKNEV